jgi:methylase of polypeptide subunit release factors
LFFLGVSVAPEQVEQALAPLPLDALERLGVVERVGAAVRATVRLVPHVDLLLAGNRYPEEPAAAPSDYVATATAPSAILATLTVRRPAATALDIGTGSGIQALWAARHCDRVVAVDVNRRALNLAAFNARLNGVTNIEFREGSLFEPVVGERFDLIVCNAPYVVSPDVRFAYRDGGIASDSFSEKLVQETPAHLEEGGFATLLVSWLVHGEDWPARPRDWIEGSGCDSWLLFGVARDPVTHAAVWNEELAGDAEEFGQTLDRWIRYLGDLEAEGVAEGAVILRRRASTHNWFRADRIPSGHPTPASEQVLRVFAARDRLSREGDDALLGGVLRLADDVRFEQELTCRDDGYVVESMTVMLDEGIGFRAGIDQNTASLLPLLDGQRSLRQAIDVAARAHALEGPDQQAFTSGALDVVRTMLELGFIASC